MVQINPKFACSWIRWLLFLPQFTLFTIARSCSGAIFFIPCCTGLDSVCASKRLSQRIPRQQCLPGSWTLSGDDCQGSWKPGCTSWRSIEDFSLVVYRATNQDRGTQVSLTKKEKLRVFNRDTNPSGFWLSVRIPLSLFFIFSHRQAWQEEAK